MSAEEVLDRIPTAPVFGVSAPAVQPPTTGGDDDDQPLSTRQRAMREADRQRAIARARVLEEARRVRRRYRWTGQDTLKLSGLVLPPRRLPKNVSWVEDARQRMRELGFGPERGSHAYEHEKLQRVHKELTLERESWQHSRPRGEGPYAPPRGMMGYIAKLEKRAKHRAGRRALRKGKGVNAEKLKQAREDRTEFDLEFDARGNEREVERYVGNSSSAEESAANVGSSDYFETENAGASSVEDSDEGR